MKFNEEEPVQYTTAGCALCGLAIIQNVCILPFICKIPHHHSIKSHGDPAPSGWREVVAGGVPRLFPFCAAQQVLDEFRDQFIQDMDSNAVVLDLLHYDIINRGDQRKITRTEDPTEQNEFLHLYLKEKCTEDAFHLVCDIISSVKGNPKMSALGTAMKRRLVTGNCVCEHVCEYVCV